MTPTAKSWYCPECGLRDTTGPAAPNRYHPCSRLRGLAAPMVPVGIRARLRLREREDYVGREAPRLDPELGRPVMSIVTERHDGSSDAVVFAPLLKVRLAR